MDASVDEGVVDQLNFTSSVILEEVDMPFTSQYAVNSCNRVSYCSCDCNHIGCPVFMG